MLDGSLHVLICCTLCGFSQICRLHLDTLNREQCSVLGSLNGPLLLSCLADRQDLKQYSILLREDEGS